MKLTKAPMTNYLEAERGTRGETPGALTFDERLSRSWLNGRRYEATEARERFVHTSKVKIFQKPSCPILEKIN